MGALFSLGTPWATGYVTGLSITRAGSGYTASSNLPTINLEHRKRVQLNGQLVSNELTNVYVDITVGGSGEVNGFTITNGGLFYEVGDVLTIVADEYTEPAELTVTSVEP